MAGDFGGGNTARNTSVWGGSYGITIIGAAVYFIGHAPTFWAGVLGFFKALVWPTFVVYKVLEQLNL